jgi:hypothetical protein
VVGKMDVSRCCCGCDILSIPFGEISLPLLAWTFPAGTWSNSDAGVSTSDAFALAIADKAHPRGVAPFNAEADLDLTAGFPSKARLIAGFVDPDNYVFAQRERLIAATFTGWTYQLMLGKRTGGLDAELARVDLANASGNPSVGLCWSGTVLTASMTFLVFGGGFPVTIRISSYEAPVGDKFGVGTGDVAVAAEWWRFYVGYEMHNRSRCPECVPALGF